MAEPFNAPGLAEGTTLDALRGLAQEAQQPPPSPELSFGQKLGLAFLASADPVAYERVNTELRRRLTAEAETDQAAFDRRRAALTDLASAEDRIRSSKLFERQLQLTEQAQALNAAQFSAEEEQQAFEKAQVFGEKIADLTSLVGDLSGQEGFLDVVTEETQSLLSDTGLKERSGALYRQARLMEATLASHALKVQAFQNNIAGIDFEANPAAVLSIPDGATDEIRESFETVESQYERYVDILADQESLSATLASKRAERAQELKDQLANVSRQELDTADAFIKTQTLAAQAEEALLDARDVLGFGKRQFGGLGQEFSEAATKRQILKEKYSAINPKRITEDLGSQMTGPELKLAEGIVLDHLAPFEQQQRQLNDLARLNEMVLARMRTRFLMKGVTPAAVGEFFGGRGLGMMTSPQFMGATPTEDTLPDPVETVFPEE